MVKRFRIVLMCFFLLLFALPARTSQGKEVILGGQMIGISLKTSGMKVVGYYFIRQHGLLFCPGEKAGIAIGDELLAFDSQPLIMTDDVSRTVKIRGQERKSIHVVVMHENKKKQVLLTPAYDEIAKEYRIGLYLRDATSGVGTLTFIDPITFRYGALGHRILDEDSQGTLNRQGKIRDAFVIAIDRAREGHPGAKQSIVGRKILGEGTIDRNSSFGIYGKLSSRILPPQNRMLAPVADISQIHPGQAQLYTVLHGQVVQPFAVRIERVFAQDHAQGKGMLIRVVDPTLIRESGGILQGMSGSPIVQGGKLVGAVTHVFLNNPLEGYAIYAKWMVSQVQGLQSK
nr:SpoIVB peptidase [Bacilli bacterium]